MLVRLAKEVELLDQALVAFRRATGLTITIERQCYRPRKGLEIDAALKLKANGQTARFDAEIKHRLTNATLGALIPRLERFPNRGLIVTEYINPRMADRLREMDIPFIDTAGNAYLREPPLFVYIKGNKPAILKPTVIRGRLFQPTGLKVIFVLICKPELFNAPYREIAQAADVALGTVGWVMRDLREGKFLIDMGKRGRKLANKRKLFDRWTEAYPEKLRPKLVLGRYRAEDRNWWKKIDPRQYKAHWGGEVAAAKITKYLRPERVTIYAPELPGKLLLNYRLIKDLDGDIEFIRAFWNIETATKPTDLVPPLLVYADLLATGDPRNIETARMIYDKELIELIGED